jgi:HD-GYP domain-containing protein (c-di-GMP phosphodiesterase class II)
VLKSRAFDIAIVTTNALPEHNTRHLSMLARMYPHMPIVLVAENLSASESREALRRGASDIITKPYNTATLPAVIERNLERQRLELQRLMQRSTGLMLQAIEALVAAVDAKDHHTAGHSHRVAEITMSLSDGLGISNEERYALELASKLHDIGKIALPDSALNKDTSLNDQEWHAMREHPVVGAKIVGAISELAYVSTIIRHHHERLDGSGYPDGLSSSAIPYLSRIIAVADTYEALTAERAYRGRLTPVEAMAELRQGAGTLYEPQIVDTLEEQLRALGEIPQLHECEKAA